MEAEAGALGVPTRAPPGPPDPSLAPASTSGPPSPSLDFLSPSFDALKALHAPELQPPLPAAPPLDNIAKCRRLLPADHVDAIPQETQRASEASRKKHLSFKEAALRQRERILGSATHSLEGVHAAALAASPGPMDSLRRWHEAQCRVTVTTRHAGGVRGAATGLLRAYDRFMNLVLAGVTERYTVAVREVKTWTKLVPADSPAGVKALAAAAEAAGASAAAGGRPDAVMSGAAGTSANAAAAGAASGGAGGGSGPASPSVAEPPPPPPPPGMVAVPRSRLIRRREVRQRQLGQIFIKGDNVVSVYSIESQTDGDDDGAGGAAPAAALPLPAWVAPALGAKRPGPPSSSRGDVAAAVLAAMDEGLGRSPTPPPPLGRWEAARVGLRGGGSLWARPAAAAWAPMVLVPGPGPGRAPSLGQGQVAQCWGQAGLGPEEWPLPCIADWGPGAAWRLGRG
ncbi:hypothetical protein HYH03_001343 [Edaphochlamys debaryana]|uniref:Sm domain-containing protein n=1 Tax=Edaphochlamys debaryana TaxID=47281 RepID=A0A835YG38_9CHLO|nr:hypothetical protein HYH03_001343 [Edaphochlamys debaryana]|eukprot:KAG2500573.1 hypothetical protein HYH03_001343 [Edaphochlamys debaryana]